MDDDIWTLALPSFLKLNCLTRTLPSLASDGALATKRFRTAAVAASSATA
jgi:hypothetical protein